jgi:hypothetical protein
MKDHKDLIASIVDDNAPITPVNPLKRFGIWVFVCVVLFAAFLMVSLRADFESMMGEPLFFVELLLALAVGLLAALAAQWLSVPDAYQKRWAIWLPFIPLSMLCFLIAYQFFIKPLHIAYDDTHGRQCMMSFIGAAAIPAVLLFFFLHLAATTRSWLTSIMAVVAVGAFGYVFVRLICPMEDLGHLLLWHYLPVVLVGVVGAIIGHKVLRW